MIALELNHLINIPKSVIRADTSLTKCQPFVFILMTDLGINYPTRFISLFHSRVWATPLIAI